MGFSCKIPVLALLGLLVLQPACAPYRRPTTYFIDHPPQQHRLGAYEPPIMQGLERYERRKEALSHWIYDVVPRHNSQIYWFDLPRWLTWTLLGNDDDGLFGEEETADYKPQQAMTVWKAAAWGLRNPFHNLFFYVIGQAYREPAGFVILSLSEQGLDLLDYRPEGGEVFAGSGGSSVYLALHGFLPFISFRINHIRQTNFYIGWRERGNFGLKAQLAKKAKQRPAPLLPRED